MPLLLLLPLALLVLVALWLVLLPISIWARYTSGRARRRAQGWVVRGNAWLLALSVPLFLLTAWVASHWLHDALRDGCIGLLFGVLVGIANVWLTRYERDAKGLIYTPNRWIVLALTTLVALRIAAGFWMAWQHATTNGANAVVHWIEAGAWTGVAGVFLGYGLAFTWGLRARLARP
ncbi:putative membrane protein [Lysobacter dokdonensis DS-58]|uniref:Putative membrane protein n=1 Tax=Lysobacter dokdonensis DS-58 TaxID=1300345 RepID=A0A0A2WKL6_9GAMM|nr:CcdC protein domain-containing protein [Lysobacter dokdonensis]KGQ19257.1 putative membrane protein [Lysobacter dokdonensis DS-58]